MKFFSERSEPEEANPVAEPVVEPVVAEVVAVKEEVTLEAEPEPKQAKPDRRRVPRLSRAMGLREARKK